MQLWARVVTWRSAAAWQHAQLLLLLKHRKDLAGCIDVAACPRQPFRQGCWLMASRLTGRCLEQRASAVIAAYQIIGGRAMHTQKACGWGEGVWSESAHLHSLVHLLAAAIHHELARLKLCPQLLDRQLGGRHYLAAVLHHRPALSDVRQTGDRRVTDERQHQIS